MKRAFLFPITAATCFVVVRGDEEDTLAGKVARARRALADGEQQCEGDIGVLAWPLAARPLAQRVGGTCSAEGALELASSGIFCDADLQAWYPLVNGTFADLCCASCAECGEACAAPVCAARGSRVSTASSSSQRARATPSWPTW